MHADEEERLVRAPKEKKKQERAIFLGQECKIKTRKVRFEKTCMAYNHKGRKSVEDISTSSKSGSRNRKKKRSERKPYKFTNSEVEQRQAQIKDEEKAARKRSFKLYAEVSGWLRKEASKDHSKLKKWIAKKYPEVKNSKEFHCKGEERAFVIEVDRHWILDSGASDHVLCRKSM